MIEDRGARPEETRDPAPDDPRGLTYAQIPRFVGLVLLTWFLRVRGPVPTYKATGDDDMSYPLPFVSGSVAGSAHLIAFSVVRHFRHGRELATG